MIKERDGADTKVVFVGPCLSKIKEIDDHPESADEMCIRDRWMMVSTVSSSDAPERIMVAIILEVRVANILAFTPLPKPSDSTTITPDVYKRQREREAPTL